LITKETSDQVVPHEHIGIVERTIVPDEARVERRQSSHEPYSLDCMRRQTALDPQVYCFVSGRTSAQSVIATTLLTLHLKAAKAER